MILVWWILITMCNKKSLSQQLAAQRAAKRAKMAKRATSKKTALRTVQQMPVKQNRLLLVKDPSRPTEQELINSQIKLYMYLSLLVSQHDLHCIRYFTLMLATVRAMNLIQPNPQRIAWADKAEQEMESSISCQQRRTHFNALKALVADFAESLPHTSKTFISECDNHAIAVLSLHIIGDMLKLPDWVFNSFGKVCAGRKALKTIAAEYQVTEATLKDAILSMANSLYVLYYCADFGHIEEPGTISALRRQSKIFMRFLNETKNTARAQVNKIIAFNKLFGVTLIDMDVIDRYARRQTVAM